tara:strand:- start:478 stop:1491 length:1014 start_codon:yes stop_codon:yes gene_type:complete
MKNFCLLIFLTINGTIVSQNILDGFKVMDLPRQNIKLGAEWIDGVGTNGPGASPENIIVNKSISNYELDNKFKQSLNLAILNFLNLDANYEKSTTIVFKNLNIYTINDFSNLPIRSNQSILYEAIKADSIYIKIANNIDANLEIKIAEKLKEADANLNGNFKDGINITGDKLFLAYRIFTLGKTNNKKFVKKIGSTNGGFNEVKVKNYSLAINNSKIKGCLFDNKNIANETDKTIINNCLENKAIYLQIKNFSDIGINGKPLIIEKEIYNSKRTAFTLSKRGNSSLFIDYIEVDYALDVDPKYGISIFMVVNPVSKISLTRTETKLKIVKNPLASGW